MKNSVLTALSILSLSFTASNLCAESRTVKSICPLCTQDEAKEYCTRSCSQYGFKWNGQWNCPNATTAEMKQAFPALKPMYKIKCPKGCGPDICYCGCN